MPTPSVTFARVKPPSFQPEPAFLEQLAQYAAGTLSAEDCARLQTQLQASREHRRFFRRYLQADTTLRESAYSGVGLLPAPAASPQLPFAIASVPHEPWYWKAAAAIATLCFLTSLYLQRLPSSPGNPEPESSVAVLTQSVGVRWREGTPSFSAGSPLAPGTFAFERGLLQLELSNGAVVVAEGPTELELLSRDRAILRSGRIRASVPPQAQGFTISTRDLDLVELAREFAVAVGSDGKAQLHVLEGEVRVLWKETPQEQRLQSGQALEWSKNAPPTLIPARSDLFTTRAELLNLSSRQSRETFARWSAHSSQIAALKDTVFHYTFEPTEPWSRTLLNQAVTRSSPQQTFDGAVVGCQWTQGRWPGKYALEFKGPTDRVRIQIPGEYPAITLMAWVRIDGWDRWLSSLLLTDSFKNGAIHWQLSDKGEMILGLHNTRLENHFSPPVISPKDLGRWIFLATTYDIHSQRVCHYLDGRKVTDSPIQIPIPLRPGDAELGNWSQVPGAAKGVRPLNGRMDEFTFLSRALSAEEIAAAHLQGIPKAD